MKTIGYIMIALPFIGLFIGLCREMILDIGWRRGLFVLGALAMLIGWVSLAGYLILRG